MRILVLNYEWPPLGGGGGVVAEQLCRAWVKQGHECTVITTRFGKDPVVTTSHGIRIFRVWSGRKYKEKGRLFDFGLFPLVAFLKAFALRLKGERFDAVHIHFVLPCGIITPLVRWLFSAPVTVTSHGGDLPNKETRYKNIYPLVGWLGRWVLHTANAVTGVNQVVQDRIKATAPDINSTLIANMVDVDHFTPGKKKKYDLLFISRLVPQKNPMFAVEAMPGILKKRPKTTLLIVGDGMLYEPLVARVKELGIQKSVTFVRWVDHDKTNKLYQESRIFLSLQQETNYGSLSLLEAMSCGLPTIATDVGQTREMVLDGRTGLLVPLNNTTALARTALELLDDAKKQEAFGMYARKVAMDTHSADAAAKKYIAVFERTQRQ